MVHGLDRNGQGYDPPRTLSRTSLVRICGQGGPRYGPLQRLGFPFSQGGDGFEFTILPIAG